MGGSTRSFPVPARFPPCPRRARGKAGGASCRQRAGLIHRGGVTDRSTGGLLEHKAGFPTHGKRGGGGEGGRESKCLSASASGRSRGTPTLRHHSPRWRPALSTADSSRGRRSAPRTAPAAAPPLPHGVHGPAAPAAAGQLPPSPEDASRQAPGYPSASPSPSQLPLPHSSLVTSHSPADVCVSPPPARPDAWLRAHPPLCRLSIPAAPLHAHSLLPCFCSPPGPRPMHIPPPPQLSPGCSTVRAPPASPWHAQLCAPPRVHLPAPLRGCPISPRHAYRRAPPHARLRAPLHGHLIPSAPPSPCPVTQIPRRTRVSVSHRTHVVPLPHVHLPPHCPHPCAPLSPTPRRAHPTSPLLGYLTPIESSSPCLTARAPSLPHRARPPRPHSTQTSYPLRTPHPPHPTVDAPRAPLHAYPVPLAHAPLPVHPGAPRHTHPTHAHSCPPPRYSSLCPPHLARTHPPPPPHTRPTPPVRRHSPAAGGRRRSGRSSRGRRRGGANGRRCPPPPPPRRPMPPRRLPWGARRQQPGRVPAPMTSPAPPPGAAPARPLAPARVTRRRQRPAPP